MERRFLKTIIFHVLQCHLIYNSDWAEFFRLVHDKKSISLVLRRFSPTTLPASFYADVRWEPSVLNLQMSSSSKGQRRKPDLAQAAASKDAERLQDISLVKRNMPLKSSCIFVYDMPLCSNL